MYIQATLQDKFLADLAKQNAKVILYLKNGRKVKGQLMGMNVEALFIKDSTTQLVYRKMINSIALQTTTEMKY